LCIEEKVKKMCCSYITAAAGHSAATQDNILFKLKSCGEDNVTNERNNSAVVNMKSNATSAMLI